MAKNTLNPLASIAVSTFFPIEIHLFLFVGELFFIPTPFLLFYFDFSGPNQWVKKMCSTNTDFTFSNR